ncbi:hypothetical protein CPAR01_05073, partial [Colletotrichum paranaense]
LNPPLLERHLTHCLARSFPSRLTRRSPRLDLRLVLSSLSQLPRCSVAGQSSLAHQHCHLGLFLVISLKRKEKVRRIHYDNNGRIAAKWLPPTSRSSPRVGQRRNLGIHLQCSSTSSTAPPSSKLWALSCAIYSTSVRALLASHNSSNVFSQTPTPQSPLAHSFLIAQQVTRILRASTFCLLVQDTRPLGFGHHPVGNSSPSLCCYSTPFSFYCPDLMIAVSFLLP